MCRYVKAGQYIHKDKGPSLNGVLYFDRWKRGWKCGRVEVRMEESL